MSRIGDIAERLAAVKAPKGMLAVRLSAVPNHDFNPGSHEYEVSIRPTWKPVRGLVEANRACLKFIDDNSLGGGNWPGGPVVDDEGNEVAQVSYNGRVWEPGAYPTPEIDARRWDMERASRRTACDTCGCDEVKADSLVGPMSAEEMDAETGLKDGPPAMAQPLRGRRDYGASVKTAVGREEEYSIYRQLADAGVQLDHHESDLWAEKTPVSERILRGYSHRRNVTTFVGQTDGKTWYDIPFAYDPFWKRKGDRLASLASRVAGPGVSPEQLYRRIRGGLLGIARDMARRFGRDQVNLRYGKSELSGTVAGHDVRVFYEVMRASNGETAGLPVLFVDGTKYARFYRNVDEKLAEVIGTPEAVVASRTAGGREATAISAALRKVIEAWMDQTWTTAEDAWRVEAKRNLKLVSVKEVGGEEGTYEFATKVTYGEGYDPEDEVVKWTVRVDQFPKL